MPRSASHLGNALGLALALCGGGCSLLSLDNLSGGEGATGSSSGGDATTTGSSASTASGSGVSTSSGGDGAGGHGAGGDGAGGETTSSTSASGGGGAGGAVAGSGGHGGDGSGGDVASGGGGAGGSTYVSPCQTTGVLDRFDRPDGSLGSDWVEGDGFHIVGQQVENLVDETGYQRAHWAEVFGPDQEAHVILSQVDLLGDEQLLLMKVQADSNIEVLYSPTRTRIEVWTCTSDCEIAFQESGYEVVDGTKLSARATADGQVLICLDDELAAEVDVTGWSMDHGQGGRIGIGTVRPLQTDPVFAFDDFGGGNVRE